MSFSRRCETENNMHVCCNFLVLHRMLWCCIPKEVNLYCSMLVIPKNLHFLTETEDIISETIWQFFSKKSKLSFLKYFEEVFIKDSNLFILLLKTLFRFKRHLKFLFGNVEYLHVKLSQRLLFQSKSFL